MKTQLADIRTAQPPQLLGNIRGPLPKVDFLVVCWTQTRHVLDGVLSERSNLPEA